MYNLWSLYDTLLETQYNLKDINLYDWNLLEKCKNFNNLKEYINDNKNFKINFNIILKIVKKITLEETNCYCRNNCNCYDFTFCSV
jgi:hypothetical protein